MNNRQATSRVPRLGSIVLWVLLVLPLTALAGIPEGTAWLSTQQNADHSFGNTAASLATPVQSTAEVLRAYQALGLQAEPAYAPALGFLNSDTESSTEFLVRKILVNASAGSDVSLLVMALVARQNSDGGYGDFAGQDSSIFDTAFALQALAAIGYTSGQQVTGAVGFLVNRQGTAGGWVDGYNAASVHLTSHVLRALWSYRQYTGVSAALDKGRSFLLSKQEAGGAWGEGFDTALVLAALVPQIVDPALLAGGIAALQAAQLENGSWADDPYTTALALQALLLASNPPADNSLGTLHGQVIDAVTGAPVANVTINLGTMPAQSLVTDSSGSFRFANLASGTYTLGTWASGYASLTAQVGVQGGQTTDLGAIALIKSAGATTGTVSGRVTDAATGQPLSGVAVMVTGAEPAITDVVGAYQISNVAPGAIKVSASKAGYGTVNGGGTAVAGGVLLFSPALTPQSGELAIRGRIVDGQSGTPLFGATVTLSGPVNQATTAGVDGVFQFSGLLGGSYRIDASAAGFFALTTSVAAGPGQFDIGDLPLSKEAGGTTGTLRGTVTDATTGMPIAGAVVSVSGADSASITTDSNGAYTITGLVPGDIVIQVSADGYVTASGAGQVIAGGMLVFSPSLRLFAEQQAVVQGTAYDAGSGQPLPGVTITISGASSATTTTDALGAYRLEGLNEGVIAITAALGGYDAVTVSGQLLAGKVIVFSPVLYPNNTMPPDANTASVSGVVVDAGTNAPLSGVTVQALFGAIGGNYTTDSEGRFEIGGVPGGLGALDVALTGYVTQIFSVSVDPQTALDLGQVRLRLEAAAVLLPDLAVTGVSRVAAVTDPQTLQLSGTLQADIANTGTSGAPAGIQVLAFHDSNGNGTYDSDDAVLGQVAMPAALAVGESPSVTIPVAGVLPFRDAPVYVVVDSDQTIVEGNETNNVLATSSACRRLPGVGGPLALKQKWYWRGPSVAPTAYNVYGPPAVARVTDTNGDGRVDEQDVPNLVFSSYAAANQGILNVVSGADGKEIWTNATAGVTAFGSAALADIDGDGLIEIVISNVTRTRLLAFNHDGSTKWSVPTGPAQSEITRDAITIADLDADGSPEIIHGRRVYRADGTLKWQGTGDYGGETIYGLVPIAADVNLDGRLEVVAGRTLYDADGNTLWHRGNLPSDGFNAVGNFDDDEFAEIVLVAGGRVYLLEHTGETIWGPVSIPGGGQGGAPTVADFDGDGKPEIGVAGASNYVVFETNGSILWTARTRDGSSHRTGSSVFDFDGDGKAEVLYADEVSFFIYDGATGTTRLKIPNGSSTTLEYPIVTDVDNDGQANIVLTSGGEGVRGVRVFESANTPWPATRPIWNQHAYHIDNINDDGTVPRNERPSWLSHNSYRLNAFPNRNPLDVPDATASLLRLVDNGAGLPFSLTVRVGNAGAAPSPAAMRVAFYQGAPAAGGTLLGSLTLGLLEPGAYRDLRLDNVVLQGNGDLYAVVDAEDRVIECDEDNNSVHIPAVPTVVLGDIGVSSDAPSYGADSPVVLSAAVTNTGSFTAGYTATLRVEDMSGVPVVEFAAQDIAPLASGASVQLTQPWNTAGIFAGSYRLRGVLRDLAGRVLDEATSDFVIGAPAALAATSVTTDKPVYQAWDLVQIDGRVRNVTTNALLAPSRVEITVRRPDGSVLYFDTRNLNELAPGALVDVPFSLTMADAVSGAYPVELVLKDQMSEVQLSASSTSFEVQRNALQGVIGQVTVSAPTVNLGDANSCTEVARNVSATTLAGVRLIHRLIGMDTGTVIDEFSEIVDLAAGDVVHSYFRNVDTSGFALGGYSCVINAEYGGSVRTLAFGGFLVVEPPIKIDSELRIGSRGRVLVLLDDPRYCEQPADQVRDPNVDGKSSSVPGDQGKYCDPDPHGPKGAEGLKAQRAFLETLLTQAGWSYTITDTAEDFTRELRTGGYRLYALSSEHEKLDEDAQKELREAVYHGEGLLVAGGHDERHHGLDEALGINYRGKESHTVGVTLTDSPIQLTGNIALAYDHVLRVDPTSAVVAGTYDLDPARYAKYCDAEEGGDPGVSKCLPKAAVTVNGYGQGRAVFAGFDLLAEAVRLGDDSLLATLVLNGLATVNPVSPSLAQGGVVPVTLTLENQGVATPVHVTITLPAGLTLVDVGAATPSGTSPETLTWDLSLAETQTASLTFYVCLPVSTEVQTITAVIEAPVAGTFKTFGNPTLVLTPEPVADGVVARAMLETLIAAGTADEKRLRQALDHLDHAGRYLSDDPDKALNELLKAADELIETNLTETGPIRIEIDGWIRAVEMQIRPEKNSKER